MSTRAKAFCCEATGLDGRGADTGTRANASCGVAELKSSPKRSPLKRSILGSAFVGVAAEPFTGGAGIVPLADALQRKNKHPVTSK